MTSGNRFLTIFLLLLGSVPAWNTVEAQDLSFLSDSTQYIWPTDASPYASSTFGETRSAHFHAGLDIRTWGQEGYAVYATRDGIVHRLGISHNGYGKVIYLKHTDGSYSLYAHLNRFESSLMAVADSIRLQDYRFALDEQIEDLDLQVRQGDLIGYTGSTGIGPPHLHFELRTPDHEPFNPLLTNLTIDDTVPPVFRGLGVEHLDPQGYHVTRLESHPPRSAGEVTDFGTIETNGPVGLSVNVYDRANRTPNVYAVYRLALVQEQDTLFSSQIDAYSYQSASQLFIDRVYPFLKEKRQGYQRLYRVNGNRLPFYRTGSTRGVVDLPEGTHTLRIIAEDFFQNRTEATVKLRVVNREQKPQPVVHSIPAYRNDVELTGQPGHRIQTHEIPLFTFHSRSTQTANEYRAGPSAESAGAEPMLYYSGEEPVEQSARKKLIPGRRQFLHLADQSIWVEFPESALFDTLHAEMTVSRTDSLPVIRFSPEHTPLKNRAEINMILDKDLTKGEPIGLFGVEPGRSEVHFLGSGNPGEVIRASFRSFTEIRLKTDNTRPVLGRPRVHYNLGGHPVVSLFARDDLSGIDPARSSIRVNGERGITEYDPDRNRIIFYHPSFQPRPANEVIVEVTDRMGNRVERTFSTIPGP